MGAKHRKDYVFDFPDEITYFILLNVNPLIIKSCIAVSKQFNQIIAQTIQIMLHTQILLISIQDQIIFILIKNEILS